MGVSGIYCTLTRLQSLTYGPEGLLVLLKSIQKPCNLKKFTGQTIGVDAYGWLHRGAVACAIELATGKPTTRYAHERRLRP